MIFADTGPDDFGVGKNLLHGAFGDLRAGNITMQRRHNVRVHDVFDHDDVASFGGQRLDRFDAGFQFGRIQAGQPLVQQNDLGIRRGRGPVPPISGRYRSGR